MDRRGLLKKVALLVVAVLAQPARVLARSRWMVRKVQDGDQRELVELMMSCVADDAAFHGECQALEWTIGWADEVVSRYPESMVTTRDGVVVGFLMIPTRKAPDPNAEVERHQKAFWCSAAGVRVDLLGESQCDRVFRHLLWRSFQEGRRLGFDYVRCASPWEAHRSLPRPFSEYKGLRLTSFRTDSGDLRYLIEWNLSDAVIELEREGADQSIGVYG